MESGVFRLLIETVRPEPTMQSRVKTEITASIRLPMTWFLHPSYANRPGIRAVRMDRAKGAGSGSVRDKLLNGIFQIAIVVGFLVLVVGRAQAQRPVQTFDPFYQGETAVRHFFDTYAIAAELSYRPPGLLQADQTSISMIGGNALGVNLRVDYRLGHNLDIGFYVDASGNGTGRSLDLSWIAIKYYKRMETDDYAFRLAIDPSSDGRSGFPQADLGFLYSTPLSATVTQDVALGMRRVRIGFQELATIEPPSLKPGDPIVSPPGATSELIRGRTQGWEMHFAWSHNILFDPAGSNLFISFMAEGGKYDLLEWNTSSLDDSIDSRTSTQFTGGVLWIRSGLQVERPVYQFAPFLSIPIRQWAHPDDDWPRSRARVGVRLMLR